MNFFIFLLLMPPQVFAGDEIGNGGDVVLCKTESGEVETATMLDYYEGQYRNIPLDLGAADLEPIEKVELALMRLNKQDTFFTNILRQKAQTFFDNASIIPGISLRDIPDSNEVFLGHNCEIQQIAINQKVTFPGDKKFVISKDYWDLLDNDNKAGLILHEIIYDYFIEQGHLNSRAARYFNTRISANNFSNITEVNYKEIKELLRYEHSVELWDEDADYDLMVGKVFTYLDKGPVKAFYSEDDQDVCIFESKTIETGVIEPFFDRYKVFEKIKHHNLIQGDEKGCSEFSEEFTEINLTNKKQFRENFKKRVFNYEKFDKYCKEYSKRGFACDKYDLQKIERTKLNVSGKELNAIRIKTNFIKRNPKTGEVENIELDETISQVNPYLDYFSKELAVINGETYANIVLTKIENKKFEFENNYYIRPFYSRFYSDGSIDVEGWKHSENSGLIKELRVLNSKARDEKYFPRKWTQSEHKATLSGIHIGEQLRESHYFHKGENDKYDSCTIDFIFDYVVADNDVGSFKIKKLARHAKISGFGHTSGPAQWCKNKLSESLEVIKKATLENSEIQVLTKDHIKYEGIEFEVAE